MAQYRTYPRAFGHYELRQVGLLDFLFKDDTLESVFMGNRNLLPEELI